MPSQSRTWTWTGTLLIILAAALQFTFTGVALANEPAAEEGIPSRLVIPTINLDTEITPVGWKPVVVDGKTYGQWETADNVVGWHNLSATLGQAGNTVLAGHSDVYAKIFRNLEAVNLNDTITVFSGSQEHHYVVTQKFLVKEKGVSVEERIENAKWIAATEDERLTLITCAYPGATHRLIVIAHPIRS